MQLLLGEAEGRVRVSVGGLPRGVIAVTVPKARDGEPRLPKDRHGLLRPDEVDLIADGPVDAFEPPDDLPVRHLIFVLEAGRRDWATVEKTLGRDRAWETAIALVRCGGVLLRCQVDDILHLAGPTSWRRSHAWSLQHADLLNDLRGRPDPDELRCELLDLMSQVDELDQERQLLAACPSGSPFKVPLGSAVGTIRRSVYEHVIRAAAVWWPHQRSGGTPLTAKGLAAKAFRNSKGWTVERELAFSNLISMSFDQAVSEADTEIRLRGPLVWQLGQVAADATVAEPWISVPARGIRAAGVTTCTARGILLVENSDTLEQVCKVPEIIGNWLCIWAEGYTSRGLLALLSYLAPRPIAAWCDLDADGIQIIDTVSRKLKREIVPVGMDIEFWQSTPHRRQEPDQIARDKPIAAKLAVNGPKPLRPLAFEIAQYGGSCEQEAIQDQIIPNLPEILSALKLRMDGSGKAPERDRSCRSRKRGPQCRRIRYQPGVVTRKRNESPALERVLAAHSRVCLTTSLRKSR
jgi:hypothetical protein